MAKEAKKTKPITIRFNVEKLEFLMTQRKSSSIQENVDYLLDRFWWEMGGDVLSVKPTEKITSEFVHTDTDRTIKAKFQPPTIPSVALSLCDTYKQEFLNARSGEDIGVTLMVMKKDTLSAKEKGELEAFATKVFNDKGFYHD